MDSKISILQSIECSILEDIDSICTDNGLKYYLIGGTLLGAVRHKGFIPWDDDIDIVMYRNDYNKLIEILQKDYHTKYFVQTFYTDKHYLRYVLKVRLNGTKLVESYLTDSKSNNGIYIDIFPLDQVQKNGGVGLKIRGAIVRCLFGIKGIKNGVFISNNIFKRIIGTIFRVFTFLIPDKLINCLFDYVCSKDNKKNCKYTTNFASHFKWKKQLFENEVYGDGVRLEFEGRFFNAPKEYLVILERLYGKNFMDLPPEEKRVTHDIVELDFGKYYTGLISDEKKITDN